MYLEGVDAAKNLAIKIAMWRALHLRVDAPPHVLKDDIGLQIAAPGIGWRRRGDMKKNRFRRARASIVARGRFIEDLVLEKNRLGVDQYVILGAGLDTFAQRRREFSETLRIFEVDDPDLQGWKRQRLVELGFGIPDHLQFVPAYLGITGIWWSQLLTKGFDPERPAVLAALGLSTCLSRETTWNMLCGAAGLAAKSVLVMTFMLPPNCVDPEERHIRQEIGRCAQAAGEPFMSYLVPDILELAREAGFKKIQHLSSADLTERYFSDRVDRLCPSNSEHFLVAEV